MSRIFRALQLSDEAALQSFLDDFTSHGEDEIPAYFPGRDWPHRQIVDDLSAWSRGDKLKQGWVPCSTYFCIKTMTYLGWLTFGIGLRPSWPLLVDMWATAFGPPPADRELPQHCWRMPAALGMGWDCRP